MDYEETEAQEGILFYQICFNIFNLEIEPVDEGLLKELEQLQQETESVLAQVVRHRRSFPGKSLDKLSKELSALLEETHESTYIDQLEAPEQPDDSLLSRLSAGVEKSVKLQSDIPQVIAKLERARTVLHEQGQKRASEMKKPATEWSLAVGDNDAITGFNDVLTRHRRTSHQFDLAHKLSSWN